MLQYTVVENTVVKYNKNRDEYYTIPMYSANAIEIKFILDDSWKEYVVTVQISNGEKTYNLLLENNTAFIPADITAGIWNVSIFGVKGEEKRNTTIPSDFCVVEEGFKSDGQPAIPPEPDLYQKLLSEIQKGIEIAQSVRNDADVGKFNGEDGNGIERIELVNKVDKVTTYKIIFTNGEEFEYQIVDGADGKNGVDGITPTIGENGNWFIGDVDTGKPARGEKGEQGEQGLQGIQGIAGQDGKDGTTPDISINATVNNTTGTPSVSVEKTGTIENPIFNLSFKNLKGENAEIDLKTLEKVAIKTFIEGNPAMSGSSAEWRIPLIEAYGKSTQEAEPTSEAPQDIKSPIATGIKITDGAEQEQTIPLSTPVTLRGIPSETGNVTIDGQKYLSDYIGQKDGVYGVFRSFFVYKVTGNEDFICFGGGYVEEGSFDAYFNIGQYAPEAKRDTPHDVKWGLCNFLSFNTAVWSKRGEIGFCYNLGQVHIRVKNETISATQEMEISQKTQLLKDYLKNLYDSGTPMIFLHPLATETFEPLPEPDQQALKDLKTFYPTSVISWETEDGAGAWTRVEIIHDPTNYIDEKLGQITAQQTALQAELLKIGGSI